MTDATCRICSNTYSDRGMTRHLTSCLKKHGDPRRGLHLRIVSTWDSTFWMQVIADVDKTLVDLDLFVRRVWLECCDHLSEFEIDGTHYSPGGDRSDYGFGPPMDSTDVALLQVLPKGETFSYTYDFGSSTDLEGTSYGTAPWPEEMELDTPESAPGIRVLARNEMPDFECTECKRTAEWICSECQWHEEGFLCDEHARDHPCGPDMLLPVVNSPRMGVCGYTGSSFDDVDYTALRR